MAIKRQHMRDARDGGILCLSLWSISQTVILQCGFARSCHWEKAGNGTRDLSALFLTTACESTVNLKIKIFNTKRNITVFFSHRAQKRNNMWKLH